MGISVAVIPAAGRGTRFLPFTKAVPKELLPVGSTPAIQCIVDECVDAGIDEIVVVTSRTKPSLGAYLTPSPDLVEELRAAGHAAEALAVEHLLRDVHVTTVYQDSPRGLGHAVACARQQVDGRPFAVLLPDEIMGDSSLLRSMVAVHQRLGGGVVGLKAVPADQVHRYGIIEPSGEVDGAGVVAVRSMVEKPRGNAPSNLAIIGRYVLSADIFDVIEHLPPGAQGEIQLTDAMRVQAEHGPFHGVLSDVTRHDTGTPLGWFQAVVDTILDDPEIGPRAAAWMRHRLDAGS